MTWLGLATDYDGTLADLGVVPPETLALLHQLRPADLRLVVVSGRLLPDLRRVFPALSVADLVVAENGAVLFDPLTLQTKLLGPTLPPELLAALRAAGVPDLEVGEVLIAAKRAHEETVRSVVRDVSPGHVVIPNRDGVMVLPAGVDKSSGVACAAELLGLDIDLLVGVGDGENDVHLLQRCGLGAAVGDAVEELSGAADVVLTGTGPRGVNELVTAMLTGQLPATRAEGLRAG